MALNCVSDLHHFHLWSLDGESHVLTVHLTLKQILDSQQQIDFKEKIKHNLEEFKLEHTTIEFEWPDEVCRDS